MFKISKILEIIGVDDHNNQAKIYQNLQIALINHIFGQIAHYPSLTRVIKDYHKANFQDKVVLDEVAQKLSEYYQSSSVDFDSEYTKASDLTLQTFIAELKPSVTPDVFAKIVSITELQSSDLDSHP